MKYYIVALFDDESYRIISPIQKNLSKKFRANRNSPQPYIAVESLDNPNLDRLNMVVEKVLQPYKKFKIELCDNVSINEATRTIDLKIEDIGYIKKISRVLSDTLKLYGLNPSSSEEEEPAISLANVNYIKKDNKTPNDIACDQAKDNGKNLTLKVDRFEIWKISNSKRETLIKSYCLRNF